MGKITHKVPILSKRILLDIFPRGMTVNVADLEGDTKEGNREILTLIMSTDNYCTGALTTSTDEVGFSNIHMQARYLPTCPLGVLSTNIQFITLKCKSTAK